MVSTVRMIAHACDYMVYSSFDNVDASLTLIDQCLENATENSQITVDGYKLC